ncbi:MAG: MFS transporter [Clostridiales bacterium]|nr:MFS transporter [Clostridiales bacterium]
MSFRANIKRVVAARFLARAGSEAAFFIGVWGKAAYELQASAAQLALVMLSLSIALIAGAAIGGVLVDRFGPRNVLIYAHIAFVPAALAIVLADSIPALAVLVGIWGFAGAPILTAGASFAPFIATSAEELKRANALIEGAGSAAFVIGPAIGALIATYANVDLVFYIDAGASIAAAIIVWSVSLAPHTRSKRTGGALAEMTQGMRITYSIASVRFYVLIGTAVWLGFGVFGALEPLFFRDVVGTGVETIGWMNSLLGLGFVVGAFVFDRLPTRSVTARGLTVAAGAIGTSAALYVLTPELAVIGTGAFLLGTVAGIFSPLQRTLIHRDTPREYLGRVIGASEVHHRAGELVPLAFAPLLAATFGVQATLIAGGVAIIVIAAAALIPAARIDRGLPPRAVELKSARVGTDEPFSPNP